MAAAMMPILNPATLQDYLDFGLLGFALSRYSGCWVGFKAIGRDGRDFGAPSAVDIARPDIVIPADFAMPPGGLNIRWPDPPLEQEERLHGPRMAAVAAFARANRAGSRRDRAARAAARHRCRGQVVSRRARRRWMNSASSDDDVARARYPAVQDRPDLAAGSAGRAAFRQRPDRTAGGRGEARLHRGPVRRILYNLPADRRPTWSASSDEDGARCCPARASIARSMVARAIAARLLRLGADVPRWNSGVARLREPWNARAGQAAAEPDAQRLFLLRLSAQHLDQRAGGQPRDGRHRLPLAGDLSCRTGAPHLSPRWAARARPGSARRRSPPSSTSSRTSATAPTPISGLLAIRAAAAAGVNITYKILFNDAVAMTGGQPVEGGLTVPQIAHQVAAEGARKIVVVSATSPTNIRRCRLSRRASHFTIAANSTRVQRELREVPGLTVLIYDQTCAAEKRRRRKRGTYPDPAERVFINDAVCEGCGDCSRSLELHLGAAGRDGIRPQARASTSRTATRTFPASRASAPASSPSMAARCARRESAADAGADDVDPAAGLPAPAAADERPDEHPRHRHRRHRRHHHRRAARHGRASRRQGLHGARLHRPFAEERRRHQPCAHRCRPPTISPPRRSDPAAPRCCWPATWWSPTARPRCRAWRRARAPWSTAISSRPPPSCRIPRRGRTAPPCSKACGAALGGQGLDTVDATRLATL